MEREREREGGGGENLKDLSVLLHIYTQIYVHEHQTHINIPISCIGYTYVGMFIPSFFVATLYSIGLIAYAYIYHQPSTINSLHQSKTIVLCNT